MMVGSRQTFPFKMFCFQVLSFPRKGTAHLKLSPRSEKEYHLNQTFIALGFFGGFAIKQPDSTSQGYSILCEKWCRGYRRDWTECHREMVEFLYPWNLSFVPSSWKWKGNDPTGDTPIFHRPPWLWEEGKRLDTQHDIEWLGDPGSSLETPRMLVKIPETGSNFRYFYQE